MTKIRLIDFSQSEISVKNTSESIPQQLKDVAEGTSVLYSYTEPSKTLELIICSVTVESVLKFFLQDYKYIEDSYAEKVVSLIIKNITNEDLDNLLDGIQKALE